MIDETHDLREDLDYVREVVERADTAREPRAIWYLWALISGVGFALIDFVPERVGAYWAVAGPVGFLLSAWLGARHARSRGQVSEREGWKYLLHWGGLLLAILLLVPLGATGVLSMETLPRVILLLVAFTYYLAGVHLSRPGLWVAGLLAVGYVSLFFLDRYAWTLIGGLIAVALIVTAHTTRVGGR